MAVENPIVCIIVESFSRPIWTLAALLPGFTGEVRPTGADHRTLTAIITLEHWSGVPAGLALTDPQSPAGHRIALALHFFRQRARRVQLIVRPSEASQVGAVHTLTPGAAIRRLPDLAQKPGGVQIEVSAS